MDEGIRTAPGASYALRLVLIFLGSMLGLLVLSLAFGASSARADDGGPSGGTLGSSVAGAVSEVTQPVRAVTHAVSAAVDTAPVAEVAAPVAAPVVEARQAVAESALADLVAATPAAALIEPIAAALGDTVTRICSALVPVTGTLFPAGEPAVATLTADSAAASTTSASNANGQAHGTLGTDLDPVAGQDGIAGATAGPGPIAALAGAAFAVLLVRRHRLRASRAMPGSPFFGTDSSPD